MDFWKHPLNPSYTSVETPQIKSLPAKGYALVAEELAKRELDEEVLKRENEILETLTKVDENLNYRDSNNNDTEEMTNVLLRRNKNSLNELPPSSQCGLAIATIAYKND